MLEVGLKRDAHDDVLPGGDAAEHAAGVVRQEAGGRHLVAMLAALLLDGREAGADLDALDRVDAHHRVRDVRVELVEHRLAEPRRHAGRDDVDARTDRVARATQLRSCSLELFEPRGSGQKNGLSYAAAAIFGSSCSGPSCAR